jgi:transposase InsO family protein
VSRFLLGHRWSWNRIAGWFSVAGRTLRHWCRRLLSARPLGRPARRSPHDVRNGVIRLLDELGPHVGLPTLRASFPILSRAELTELLARYRRVWRKRHRQPLRILTWPVPGRVWAIDFAEPPTAVDGRFGYLLAVRDLASGRPLLWKPVAAATAEDAADAVAALVAEHGAPLVLKSDNGSPFTGEAFTRLLAVHRIAHLLSPPYWPRYNGAIEAGIHALKDRTAAHAARAGHPGHWSHDDVSNALAEAQQQAHPLGEHGPDSATLWKTRSPITGTERDTFQAAVQSRSACIEATVPVCSKSEMARTAIRLALEQCGYLHYRRRLIPPPIPGRKVARII